MIYTITFNPAIDYIVDVRAFKTDYTNRTFDERILPGGKGINVSIVLKNLGIDNTALGFIAGFTGKEIQRLLNEMDIKTNFIEVENGFSRINVKLRSIDETEINGKGPEISKADVDELFSQLDILEKGDILVLAGSIPDTLPSSMYRDIMEYLKGKDLKIVVDATNDLLVNVLEFKPFLIKPNKYELEGIFGVDIDTREDLITYAKKLKEMGAVNVLVSLGKDGALLVNEFGEVLEAFAPKGELINSVGAGDSMVAGFISGYLKNENYIEAFKTGLSAGSASAFSENLATKEEVENILNSHSFNL